MILDFDDAVEEMGEKGFRIIGDCGSQAPKECFFIGKPAMSKPLLPAKQWTEMRKIMWSKEQEDKKAETNLSADFENYLSVNHTRFTKPGRDL